MASHKYQDKRTKLPQVLLDQVNAKDGELASGASTSRRRIVDRRSARKSKREELKSKKSQFFSRKREEPFQTAPRTAPGTKRPAETAQDTPSKRPKIKDERQESKSVSSSAKFSASRDTAGPSVALSRTKPSTKPKPAQTPLERLAVKSISIRDASDGTPKTRKRQKDAEDDEIAWLEAKLGLGSKKKKGKGKSLYGSAFKEDGLDDILLDLDRLEEHVVGLDEDEGADDEDIHGEDDNTDEEESSSSEETNTAGLEEPHFGDDSCEHVSDDGDVPILKEVGSSDAPKAAGAYVPPHLRQKVSAVSIAEADQKPEQTKLSRQLKGLLNRLSEQNIEGIVTEVEELYRSNPRNDVTQALTSILLNSVSSSANLLDTFVILHAAFIAAVHKIIGIEFAAYLVEQTVSSYEGHWTALRTTNSNRSNQFLDGQDEAAPAPTGSKESSNLLVLLSELYNFQVISCVLIYDLIRALLSSEFSEHDVELLLKVVKNSGHQMRQDDPLALKDIIQLVQAKVQGKNANELSSRFRFMVETLVNLKNNKMKDAKRATGTGQNVASDAIERMKKYLSGIGKKRHVLSNEPLRVSLEDLHSSSKRGKWWLVGAAWGGDPLVENHNTKAQTKTKDASNKPKASVTDGLSQLARQHGMNTEVRRNIFVVLVSSDDYVDACERLTQLELQETQQREIIRVILHCCGNEQIYNPFYTLVAHHLCQNSHSHRVTLQYCLWDFLRSLGETQVGGAAISRDFESHGEDILETTIINYAKAYAWWLARGSVTMTILKPVEFMVLQPRSKQFLKLMFLQMIINSQSNSPLIDVRSTESTIPLTRNRAAIEEIVSKALRIPAMCKGIAYFLRSILVEKNFGARTRQANELLVWGLTTAQEALQRDTLSDSDL